MKNKKQWNKRIATSITTAIATGLLATTVQASDIGIGMRGPTSGQVDARMILTSNTLRNSLTQNTILKYWNGDQLGVFSFVNVPYHHVRSQNGSISGFGNIVVGIGPRGTYHVEKGSLHANSYVGASLPTAQNSLGNDSIDSKFGLNTTYQSTNKSFDINTSCELTKTGVKRLNDIVVGIVAGKSITDDGVLRVGAGVTTRMKENVAGGTDYRIGPRIIVRANPKGKKWHVVAIGDYDTHTKNMQRGFGVTALIRYNR